MTRAHRLYALGALFLLLATGFVETRTYVLVIALGGIGLLFAAWGFREEFRHGQR